ncbi:MAG: hypothetical protein ACQCXQ_04020 [Verrucomicrobiales bacterium]|nr:hypothetical protein [Verrucomicrobiota bacterium JB025]
MMIDFANTIACSTCRVTMVEGGGDAAGWSIFALLIIVVAVLSLVGFFMFRLVKREREHFDPAFSDDFTPSDH